MTLDHATFGGGCFWCTEAVFQSLRGVTHVESGYAGGTVQQPSYEAVCNGTTGHAEVIQITFDPEVIDYPTLLEVFFATHDPTQLNRQGADVGTQYRSVIFFHNELQKDAADRAIEDLRSNGVPAVTAVEPYGNYFPAEEYHQNYFRQNPTQPYCLATIPPKLKKIKEKYSKLLANS